MVFGGAAGIGSCRGSRGSFPRRKSLKKSLIRGGKKTEGGEDFHHIKEEGFIVKKKTGDVITGERVENLIPLEDKSAV